VNAGGALGERRVRQLDRDLYGGSESRWAFRSCRAGCWFYFDEQTIFPPFPTCPAQRPSLPPPRR
jgi:hypothetical protein